MALVLRGSTPIRAATRAAVTRPRVRPGASPGSRTTQDTMVARQQITMRARSHPKRTRSTDASHPPVPPSAQQRDDTRSAAVKAAPASP